MAPGIVQGGWFDPGLNAWTTIDSPLGPETQLLWTAAGWTGEVALVWGGLRGVPGADDEIISAHSDKGVVYDLAAEAWLPMSSTGAPTPRSSHSLVWTGSRAALAVGAPARVTEVQDSP